MQKNRVWILLDTSRCVIIRLYYRWDMYGLGGAVLLRHGSVQMKSETIF